MRKSRASVLVLALWTLAVLGFLAVAVGGYVSANIRFAIYLQRDTIATMQARAGVELAVAEISNNASNYIPNSLNELISQEELFRENDSLDEGAFSVVYTFYDTNSSMIVTNFGVFPESAKINIDVGGDGAIHALEAVLDFMDIDPSVATSVISNYPAEKQIAPEDRKRYFFYDGIPEVLAVGGVDENIYQVLEPLVTIQRFRFGYTESGASVGDKFAREAYGGIAEGQAFTHDSDGSITVAATRHIAFVFDRITTNFLHWREF